MPNRLCAVCRIEGTLLENSSEGSLVSYFKCGQCGRVWTDSKAHPDTPAKNVTVNQRP
jgi:uncharacterized Zn finger protein